MHILGRVALAIVVTALFVAGTAAAGVDLRRVVLRPGQCVTIAKVRVCAAKARPPVTRTVTSTVTPAPVTVTVTTTPAPQIAFRDGTYRIGADIAPGTYRSVATSDSCYWERLSGFGGTLNEIIANYFGIGPTIVAIAPTDAGFRSAGCGGWTKIG
jgi:hypothetical protein